MFNPAEVAEMKDKYRDEIYRPGDDVSRFEKLTTEEKSERRREIEEIFADPEGFAAAQEERYRLADEQPGPVTIHVP